MKGKIDSLAVVAGVVLIVLGIVLLVVSIFGFWPVAVYGIITLILGIVILMTLREQEHVEQIKQKGGKK